MAAVTIADPRLVSTVQETDQLLGVAGEAINAGQVVMRDPTSGQLMRATLATAAANPPIGIAKTSANMAGLGITVMRRGLMDLGVAALDGRNFGVPIYLGSTAGNMDDAAGSPAVIVGSVEAGMGSRPFDRLLKVNFT